jgi:hypothetical protein
MGDLIGGLRTEVLQRVTLRVPVGLDCCEYSGGGASYFVGSIVPDRDYWTVFRKRAGVTEVTPIELISLGHSETLTWCAVSDCYDLKEQVLRCQVSSAILIGDKNLVDALTDEIRAMAAEFQARPLVVNMLGQLIEFAEMSLRPPAPANLARAISGAAYLSVQRGLPPAGETNTFSSPRQRQTSRQTQVVYDEAE